ncbi:MAG: hypothetical protein DRI71_02505 [Bacteroidetes bacterium]|nr:MAG: hypothetical protein DRI71_02505 [Bacteroidota bacterium]
MKKQIVLAISLLAFLIPACSSETDKEGVYDSEAVAALDNISKVIGELNSCSYTLKTFVEENNDAGEFSQFSNTHDVYMRGPNKMHIHTIGTKGEKSYWYDGLSLAFYSYDKNIYDTVSAPESIIPAIDFLHDKYGIDFPASNFFYPDFTDDILNHFDNVFYLGEEVIDDVECLAIEASNEVNILSIWIEKDSGMPKKLILEKKEENAGFYEATFTNWRINPILPDILFEFEPPVGAERVKIEPIN